MINLQVYIPNSDLQTLQINTIDTEVFSNPSGLLRKKLINVCIMGKKNKARCNEFILFMYECTLNI